MASWDISIRENGVLLKLDFAKAYDMLDWRFIFDILQVRGLETDG